MSIEDELKINYIVRLCKERNITVLFFILSLIIPFTYIAVGLIFWKDSHKKNNSAAGWRTKRAMQNQETWDFANSYGGKSVFTLGLILVSVSVGLGILLSALNTPFHSG